MYFHINAFYEFPLEQRQLHSSGKRSSPSECSAIKLNSFKYTKFQTTIGLNPPLIPTSPHHPTPCSGRATVLLEEQANNICVDDDDKWTLSCWLTKRVDGFCFWIHISWAKLEVYAKASIGWIMYGKGLLFWQLSCDCKGLFRFSGFSMENNWIGLLVVRVSI